MTRDFSHLDETGGISMVDVGSKRTTIREAVAQATVRMTKQTLARLVEQALPKGDVLTTAKVAGVLAAKQTPSLIPLAHPVDISSVDITFDLDREAGTIEVRSIVRCEGKTGVEMEALTACTTAALVLVQALLEVDPYASVEDLTLWHKSGGRSGVWDRPVDGRNEDDPGSSQKRFGER